MTPFRVSEDQIGLLKEESLVDLLDLLLTLEAREHSIPLPGIVLSLRTKVSDGGFGIPPTFRTLPVGANMAQEVVHGEASSCGGVQAGGGSFSG